MAAAVIIRSDERREQQGQILRTSAMIRGRQAGRPGSRRS